MTKQHIKGNSNQQASRDIYNFPTSPEVACISNAQARQLRWLVDTIELLLNSYSKPTAAAEIWADLHDYCHTPAPLPNERRSQYRLMPATSFYRAKSYLLEKLWVARMTGKSKRKVKLYTDGVSSRSDDNYEDDANPDVIQKYFKKCDEVDALKQEVEDLKHRLKDKKKRPTATSRNSSHISEVIMWDGASGGNYMATITHDGENDSQSEARIRLTIDHRNGINITHNMLENGGQTLDFDLLGSAERSSLFHLFSIVAIELKKEKEDLGNVYRFEDESWEPERYNDLIRDYEQTITNSENGD